MSTFDEHRRKVQETVKDNVWRPRFAGPCVLRTHFPLHQLLYELACEERVRDKEALIDLTEDYDLEVTATREALQWAGVWFEFEKENLQEVRNAERKVIANWIRSTSSVWAEGPRQMLNDLATQIEEGDHEKFHKMIEEQA